MTHGDFGGEQTAADHRTSGADGVTQNAAHRHAQHALSEYEEEEEEKEEEVKTHYG